MAASRPPLHLPVVGAASPSVEGPPDTVASAEPTGAAHGASCHGGRERLLAAETADGKSSVLRELVDDYPLGAHDQPQGMCPAFGSLRVGLRMRRTATVLSGSACCVYGLTFTSHFYGARRTVGYVPFNSESLVTGALFEDIKKAMEDLADPAQYDTIVMTNLCIPTASGVPLDLLPKEINGVRIVGIDVPGFGVPTHAEAKDVLAGAMLKYARTEAEAGPVARPDGLVRDRPTVTLLGELFPADPMVIGSLLEPMGVVVGTVIPPREWRELYKALDSSVIGAVHPFYVRSVREFEFAGRPVVGSAPVGVDGTAAWLQSIGETLGIAANATGAAVDRAVAATRGALSKQRITGRILVSGYEGSELLVARLLSEAGAEIPYVGTALPRSRWSDPDREWLEARGTHVQYRASLEQDRAAARDVNPDLVLGTTPTVQSAKEEGTPALYFTNLISARPIFGPAGAGGIAEVIGGAMAGRDRLGRMRAFFDGVGVGHTAGYGHDGVPEKRLNARERNAQARGGKAVTGDAKKSTGLASGRSAAVPDSVAASESVAAGNVEEVA
jgi:3,8-divinyl chlorophyllide a/chlorophyllide a reductase subunit Y